MVVAPKTTPKPEAPDLQLREDRLRQGQAGRDQPEENRLQQDPLQKDQSNEDQLRRDRIAAVVMLLAIILVFGLMIWLASLGSIPEDYEAIPMPPFG